MSLSKVTLEKTRTTGTLRPVRTKPHVFKRDGKSYLLEGKANLTALDHREYLRGPTAWDHWFDAVLARGSTGTAQWTAIRVDR